MSDRELRAQITAIDKASSVFRQVADGAAKMGTSIDAANKKSVASSRDLKKAQDDIRLGAAALTAAFTLSARGLLTQEQSIRGIQKAYGDSSQQVLDFADALQDATIYSDDAGRAAALTAATLTREYGIATDQALQLTQRAADLSAIFGGDLANNTERLAAAVRGEAESAEALGVAVSDTVVAAYAAAQGYGDWNKITDESIKGQIRFAAIMEQTAYAQGSAAEQADTLAGKTRQFQNAVQDATTDLVAMTGPVAEVAGALGEQTIQAGLAVAGLAKLGSGMTEVAGKAKLASLALGPGGLVIAASAAAVGIYALVDALTVDFGEASDMAITSAENLTDAIKQLAAAGSENTFLGEAWQARLRLAAGDLENFGDEIERTSGEIERLTQIQRNTEDETFRTEVTAQIDALNKEYDALIALRDQFGSSTDAVREYAETEQALTDILTNRGVGADMARENAAQLFAAYDRGELTLTQLFEALQQTGNSLDRFDKIAIEAKQSAESLATANKAAAVEIEALTAANDELVISFEETAAGQAILNDLATIAASNNQLLIDSARSLFERYKSGTIDLTRYGDELDKLADTQDVVAKQTEARARADREAFAETLALTRAQDEYAFSLGNVFRASQDVAPAIEAQAAAMAELRSSITDIPELEAFIAEQERLKASITDVPELGAYIQNQAALRASITDIGDVQSRWNEINRDTRSALERVADGSNSAAVAVRAFKDVQDGIISQQDVFNAQYSEYGQQLSAIERAQEILNTRIEEGIPLTQEQQQFMDGAAQASERLAGGQEDAAIQAGILAQKYGENMEKGDAMNRALGDSTGATKDLADVIRDLILALDGVPAETRAKILLEGADGALGIIGAIRSELFNLDGTTATTYVRTISQGGAADNTTGGASGFRDGGVVDMGIPHARNGMTTRGGGQFIRMNEAGGEDVLVPNGSYIRPAPASRAARGQGGQPVYIGTVNLYPATGDVHAELTTYLNGQGRS